MTARKAKRYSRRHSGKLRPASATAPPGRGRRPGEEPGRRPSSTRPSSWRCGWASTPARPTRSCAAPSRCPAGTGKDVRVAVFAAGERRPRPARRGADIVGADDLVERVAGRLPRLRRRHRHARPDGPGRQGSAASSAPAGLMPNPKTGTVTTDVGKAVAEFKGGRVEYRTDRYGNIHVPIGKV